METMNPRGSRNLRHTAPNDESLAIEILSFLSADEARLLAFLEATGVSVTGLRDRMDDRDFRGGLMDYIASDDTLLVDFARSVRRRPEQVAQEIAARRSVLPD